jgi:predicted ferric reductase
MSNSIKPPKKPLITPTLPPHVLIIIYLLLTESPLLLAAFQGLPLRSFPDEVASSFGLVGFIWLLLSFLLSGRFRAISGQIGIDKTMRLHQLMAIALGLIIFLHPYFYTLPINKPLPWDTTQELSLTLTAPAFISGMIAWIILPVLIITTLFKDQLPCRYETWRALHGIGAVIIVAATAHHAFEIGRYTNSLAMKIFWLSLIAVASLTLLRTYLIMPLLQKGRPFRVVSVQPAADKMWHITLTNDKHNNFDFKAGQFTWLKLKKSTFDLTEHPFSISSSPQDLPELRFTIKESGDFTNKISHIKEGSQAYIDGPHGHFIINNQEFEGLVMIAGGIGVAPMISIIKEMAQQKDPRPIKLLYGNRKENQIAFKDELEEASKKLKLDIEYVLSEPPLNWEGLTGCLDSTTISRAIDMRHPDKCLYLLCGPPSMLEPAVKTLKTAGIPSKRIIYEKFSYL